MHRETEPAIHYWGAPVILLSTLNELGSTNVNLKRQREFVSNLASAKNTPSVNRQALGAATERRYGIDE